MFLVGVAIAACACASTEPAGNDERMPMAGSGQGGASGGATTSSTGGITATGGQSATTGGASTVTGGAPGASGGRGGGSATGGTAPSTGGKVATGGSSSTPVGLGLPYSEDFEGSVGMPAWYLNIGEDGVASGDWAQVSDGSGHALQERSKTEESWAVGGNSAWADQRLEVKFKIALTDPEAVADVRFRIAIRFGLTQSYYAEFQGNGKVQLGKQASSGGGDIGTEGTVPAFTGGSWVTVALQAKGSTISAYVNGAKCAEATDATITMGGIALGSSEEVAILYDDVHVTTPP